MSRPRAGQHGQGVPIGEAAERLGLNVDAVRKRIRRGTLPAYKDDDRWYIVLDGVQAGVQPGASSPAGRTVLPGVQGGEPIEAVYTSTTPAEVERAIEATSARYVADFAALYDRISAEVGRLYEGQLEAKDQTITAQQETIAELRHRADLAESSRLLHEPVLAAREATIATQAEALAELRWRAEAAGAELSPRGEKAAVSTRVDPPLYSGTNRPDLHLVPTLGEASAENPRATLHEGGGLRARLGRWWRGGA